MRPGSGLMVPEEEEEEEVEEEEEEEDLYVDRIVVRD